MRECKNGAGYNNFEDSDRYLVIHQLVDIGLLTIAVTQLVGCTSFVKDVVVSTEVVGSKLPIAMHSD